MFVVYQWAAQGAFRFDAQCYKVLYQVHDVASIPAMLRVTWTGGHCASSMHSHGAACSCIMHQSHVPVHIQQLGGNVYSIYTYVYIFFNVTMTVVITAGRVHCYITVSPW